MRLFVIVSFIVVLLAGALLLRSPRKDGPATNDPKKVAPREAEKEAEKIPAQPVRERMNFSREGSSAEIVAEVDRVIGAGRSTAARVSRDGCTWVCILVDDEGPWIGPEPQWPLSLFPELSEFKFVEPPPPALRTLSIYRSVTKQALKLAERDRILVLVIPKEYWGRMDLRWPVHNVDINN